ncbi:fungal-specific transcription factor domain-containing protein [Thozetella sp. PMI_491]|nr:fungal-specific transcription factor domain-containing protein [Thozetella sp. PMI_491]
MSSQPVPKKSAFSCENCRKRKVKCGGEQPECRRCVVRNDECVYKLNPTLSYTQRLENRIKELEKQLAAAKGDEGQVKAKASPSVGSPDASSSPSRPAQSPDPSAEEALAGSFSGMKIDDKGVITYHGNTSFFQLPNDHVSAFQSLMEEPAPMLSGDPDEERRERLVSNAWQQRALEDMVGTPEPFQYLLNTHWCWVQPLFNFIYRPTFTRDMQVLGPYYSHTLMHAVLSHSIRWAKSDVATREMLDKHYEGGAIFGRYARMMAFDELSRGISTVPTAQTFLLLSAQECSLGNTSQAYVYCGIAFRLIDHLGILVDGQRYAASLNLSDEDIEIRNRLFWSCYFWDKVISLYLGRSPSLRYSTVSPPQVILDDSAEQEPWIPFGLESEGLNYPATLAHSTSCFKQMCQLSVIFNEILIHMYDPLRQNTEEEMQDCFTRQEVALKQWWDDLPSPLKLEASSLPELAPPSHIVLLNCLYNTFKILLYRPMLFRRGPALGTAQPNSNHLIECVTAATSTLAIFDLFCKTFGYERCVLSLSYSLYIAASIFLLQLQANTENSTALRRLEFCIRALDRVKSINPVIGRSLGLITRALATLGINTPVLQPQPHPTTSAGSAFSVPVTHDYMFPQQPEQPRFVHQSYDQLQFSGMDTMNLPEGVEITPELFEAVASLEPLSVRVGALDEGVMD